MNRPVNMSIDPYHFSIVYVETDQSIEYSDKSGLIRLKHSWKRGKHSYYLEHHPVKSCPLRFVIFPGVVTCHVVIGHCSNSNTFWFSHVSCDQIGSEYISEYFDQPPPAYSQLIGDNYKNNAAINSMHNVDFIIIDKSGSFDKHAFDKSLGSKTKSIRFIDSKINYKNSPIFICFDLFQNKIYFINSPLSEANHPHSIRQILDKPENEGNYKITDEDIILTQLIENIILGKTHAFLFA